jgi:hypothetical protein
MMALVRSMGSEEEDGSIGTGVNTEKDEFMALALNDYI